MFKICLQKYSLFRIRISFILLCVFLPICAVDPESERNISKKYDQYSAIGKIEFPSAWEWTAVGKSANDFLSIFFIYTQSGAIRSSIEVGYDDFNLFVNTVIGYTFIQQIAMTITVSLGTLGICLLLLMPCFISLYRQRQSTAAKQPEVDSAVVSPEQGWIIFEFLIVFLAVAVFGGILMCVSVIEFHDELPQIFESSIFAIETTYRMKEIILYNYYYTLSDISRNAFETIQLMYDINEDISITFMEMMDYRIKPVRYLAKSIHWDVIGVQKALESDLDIFKYSSNETNYVLETSVDEYLAALNSLKKVFDLEKASNIFGNVVDPLLSFPSYNFTNTTIENYEKSISKLDSVIELDLQTRLQNLSRYLQTSVEFPNYDPSPNMEKLRSLVFQQEMKIRSTLNRYVNILDLSFKNGKMEESITFIKSVQYEVVDRVEYAYIFIMVFSMMSASLGLFFFFLYLLGVVGTKGFLVQTSDVSVHTSGLSHGSGRLMIFFIYFSAVFLACFWALSLFLFVMFSVPFELCLSSKDLLLLDVTIDHPVFHRTAQWYNMYSSRILNSTLKSNIQNCAKDKSYFFLLLDPIIDKFPFEDLKSQLDTDAATSAIQNAIGNLPSINISDSELATLNLDGLLDIEIHSYFQDISNLIETLSGLNASSILNEIKNHPKSSKKLKSAASTAFEFYESLVISLSNVIAAEDSFNSSIKSINISVKMLQKQLEYFFISSEALDDFIHNNSTEIYTVALNNSLKKSIDSVLFNLELSAFEFRKGISFCPILDLLYQKHLFIMCELLSYPVSACWMGSFFVDIFLLIAVLLCLYSVPLFLTLPKSNSSVISRSNIRPEDIPSAIRIETESTKSSSLDEDSVKPVVERNDHPSSSKHTVTETTDDIVNGPSTSKVPIAPASIEKTEGKNDENGKNTIIPESDEKPVYTEEESESAMEKSSLEKDKPIVYADNTKDIDFVSKDKSSNQSTEDKSAVDSPEKPVEKSSNDGLDRPPDKKITEYTDLDKSKQDAPESQPSIKDFL